MLHRLMVRTRCLVTSCLDIQMKFPFVTRLMASVLRMANYDFCPNLNQYVYWLKQPIGWVVTACLFSILIGLFVGPQGYVLAVAFFALLILGLVWPWLSMKAIRCSLTIPDGPMQENESGELVFSVRNYWPIPVFGLMVEGDFLQDVDPDAEPIAFSLKRIPAFSRAEYPVPITPRRRGILPAGEVKISNGFPFGLADVSKPLTEITPTLVWPQREPLEGSPPAEGNLFNLVGSLADRAGNDGESIGIRCYREGDRLRNIHWAQTVRSQKLMVRERQTPSSTVATVLLDLSPDHHSGTGVDSSFEWAIRIAASICYQLHRTSSSVRVVCLGLQSSESNSVANHQGIEGVMDFLARLPTLEMQRDLPSHEVSSTCRGWSRSTQTFFVCTSSSAITKFAGSSIASIVIDLNGFAEKESAPIFGEAKPQVSAPALSGRIRKKSIFVTTPLLAPSQLESAWRGSFENAG